MVLGETEIVLRLFFGFLFLIFVVLSEFSSLSNNGQTEGNRRRQKIELNRLFIFKYLFYISCTLCRPPTIAYQHS